MADFLDTTPVDARLDQGNYIPISMLRNDLISKNSSAYTCFTKQKFSGILQAFLVQYVISTSGYQALYK